MVIQLISILSLFILIFSSVALTLSKSLRRASVFSWFTGIGTSGVLLTNGSELLAVILLLISSVFCVVFYTYSRIFRPTEDRIGLSYLVLGFSITAGAFFGLGLDLSFLDTVRISDFSTFEIGTKLQKSYFLGTLLLAVLFLLGIIGSGLLGRPETRKAIHK